MDNRRNTFSKMKYWQDLQVKHMDWASHSYEVFNTQLGCCVTMCDSTRYFLDIVLRRAFCSKLSNVSHHVPNEWLWTVQFDNFPRTLKKCTGNLLQLITQYCTRQGVTHCGHQQWEPFCRRYLQTHCSILIRISLKYVHSGPFDNKPALV